MASPELTHIDHQSLNITAPNSDDSSSYDNLNLLSDEFTTETSPNSNKGSEDTTFASTSDPHHRTIRDETSTASSNMNYDENKGIDCSGMSDGDGLVKTEVSNIKSVFLPLQNKTNTTYLKNIKNGIWNSQKSKLFHKIGDIEKKQLSRQQEKGVLSDEDFTTINTDLTSVADSSSIEIKLVSSNESNDENKAINNRGFSEQDMNIIRVSSNKKSGSKSSTKKKSLFRILAGKGNESETKLDVARSLQFESSNTKNPSKTKFEAINSELKSHNKTFSKDKSEQSRYDNLDLLSTQEATSSTTQEDAVWVCKVTSHCVSSPNITNTRNESIKEMAHTLESTAPQDNDIKSIDQLKNSFDRIEINKGSETKYENVEIPNQLPEAVSLLLEKKNKELEHSSREKETLVQKIEMLESKASSLQQELDIRKETDFAFETEQKTLQKSERENDELHKELTKLQVFIKEQKSEFQAKLTEQAAQLKESISLQFQKDYEMQQQDLRSQLETQKQNYENRLHVQEKILTEEITARVTETFSQRINDMQLRLQEAQIQTSKIQDEHATEIEEMIEQLDEVEAEHEAKLQGAVKEVSSQKEIVITALSAHLAEERKKVDSMATEHEKYREMIELAEHELQACRNELGMRVEEYENILKEEKQNRIHSERKIEQDMRNAAEKQFSDANKYYLKLKSEYDVIEEENHRLIKELELADIKSETLGRDCKAKEMEYITQIAQMKAALATVEANRTRLEQEYSSELEAEQEKNIVLRQKLDDAKTNCTQAHMSLATIVNEKEKLENENRELNSVCEELMAIVEGK